LIAGVRTRKGSEVKLTPVSTKIHGAEGVAAVEVPMRSQEEFDDMLEDCLFDEEGGLFLHMYKSSVDSNPPLKVVMRAKGDKKATPLASPGPILRTDDGLLTDIRSLFMSTAESIESEMVYEALA
jgi:hypothetical protein